MRVRRQAAHTCVGCGRTIPSWWFSAGDDEGWWHWHCIIIDNWRRQRGHR